MRKTSLLLAAALIAVGLTACSSAGRPSGCDAPNDVDLSDSLKAEAAYFEDLNSPLSNNSFAFSIVDDLVLKYPNCFAPDYVQGFEESTKTKANWDGDPNYGATAAFLPKGNITSSTTATEVVLSDDNAVLKKAFDTVRADVEEGDGTYTDYSVELATVGSSIQLGTETNRDRDIVNMSLGLGFQARVDMEGKVEIWMSAHFDARDAERTQLGLEGLCNGLLFEAGGEAFKIPSEKSCGFLEPSDSGFYFDYWIITPTDFEGLDHLVKVLATGAFSVFLVDGDGANHEFKFNSAAAKDISKNALIIKAIESGFGY